MALYKVHRTKNYTIMSNHHLRDKRLSLKSKGLLSMMLSLPDDWQYSVVGISSICKESQTAIESALSELKSCGYLSVTKKYSNETVSKHFEYIYDIFEVPQEEAIKENQPMDSPEVGNPWVENLGVENRPQINIDKQNTDKQKTDILNTENTREAKPQKRFARPTVEEIREYCQERNNGIDPEKFYDYYESKGWMIGKGSPMRDWKATVRNWERREQDYRPQTANNNSYMGDESKYCKEEPYEYTNPDVLKWLQGG